MAFVLHSLCFLIFLASVSGGRLREFSGIDSPMEFLAQRLPLGLIRFFNLHFSAISIEADVIRILAWCPHLSTLAMDVAVYVGYGRGSY